MKANQSIRSNDDAVSPVIAVILMVAITVVLAATVYVWVSGFGSNSNTSVAHTMSIASAGPITNPSGTIYTKSYTVSSADPSLKWGDIKLTVEGNQYTFVASCTLAAAQWDACAGTTPRLATDAVQAGDKITIRCDTASCLDNKALLLLDTASNSVMVSLTIR